MTSARVTEKVVSGDYFCTDPYIGDRREFFHGPAAITMHGMDYKTNATWSDAELITEYCNYPVWLRDDYGQGELYIWNIPDNYSDLYRFPVEVADLFRKTLQRIREYIWRRRIIIICSCMTTIPFLYVPTGNTGNI